MSSSSCSASPNIQVVSAELEKSEADAAKFLDENMGKARENNGGTGLPHHYIVDEILPLTQTGRVSWRNFKKKSRLVKY